VGAGYRHRRGAGNGGNTGGSCWRRSRTLWRRRDLGRCHWTRGQNGLCNGRNRPRRGNRWWRRGNCRRLGRRHNSRLGGSGRRRNCGRWAWHYSGRLQGRRNRLFLLRNCLKDISRPGNIRKVNLGLDFFFAAGCPCRLRGRRLRLCGSMEVGPHLFRLVLFERTGVRLLLRHSDQLQRVENGFALDFQFPGEIVDSNLAHPAFLVSV
jgi:hypothetical protein